LDRVALLAGADEPFTRCASKARAAETAEMRTHLARLSELCHRAGASVLTRDRAPTGPENHAPI